MSVYQGPERRKYRMNEKSIDRELGELTLMVRALTEKVDSLSREFTEYKAVSQSQFSTDYKYLDDKIFTLDRRIGEMERLHIAEESAKKTVTNGLWSKIKAKAIDVTVGALMLGILSFVVYLFIEWVQTK